MSDYDTMTDEDFDRLFQDSLQRDIEEKGVSVILAVPGVWELLREEYNNEVLTRWEQEQDDIEEPATIPGVDRFGAYAGCEECGKGKLRGKQRYCGICTMKHEAARREAAALRTETPDHHSTPNGCAEDCPACAGEVWGGMRTPAHQPQQH
jgi:hypothetical protein